MSTQSPAAKAILPSDQRNRLGGLLFLISLFMFFIASILLYVMYAFWRRNDPQSDVPLPPAFLVSTVCLLLISIFVNKARRSVRRSRRIRTSVLLMVSALAAVLFMNVQFRAMTELVGGPATYHGTGKGVAGMVVVLALLHALHVFGGVIALAIVSVRSFLGRYDHERYWPVDFTAQYWHFLDAVWLCMLTAFWITTGGFVL